MVANLLLVYSVFRAWLWAGATRPISEIRLVQHLIHLYDKLYFFGLLLSDGRFETLTLSYCNEK